MSDQGKRAAGFRRDAALFLCAVPKIRKGPPFRGAVAALAGRVRRLTAPPAAEPDDFWLAVRKRLLELPQMRAADPAAASAAAAFGRRSADRKPGGFVPAPGFEGLAGRLPAVPTWLGRVVRRVPIAAPNGNDWLIAAALIAFFALGYLAAMASGSMAS